MADKHLVYQSVADARRLAKALEVVEAARLYVKADEEGEPWPAPAITLRAALAAFDEVQA
jgi:hypothetical protein